MHPKQADRRLDAIAARLGINVTGRHTALGDALITAAVFVALIPGLAEHGIVTLKQAADACAADLELLGLELKRVAQTRQLCRRCAPRKRRAWAFLVIFMNRNARRAFALRFRNGGRLTR